MLRIDGADLRPRPLRKRGDQRAPRDEAFLVGERYGLSPFDGGEHAFQPGKPHHGGEQNVVFRSGAGGQSLLPADVFRAGGKLLAEGLRPLGKGGERRAERARDRGERGGFPPRGDCRQAKPLGMILYHFERRLPDGARTAHYGYSNHI